MRVVQTGPIAGWLGSGGAPGAHYGVRRRSLARERAVARLWDALLGDALAEQPPLEPALAAAVLETLTERPAAQASGRPRQRVESPGAARALLSRLQQLAGGSLETVVGAHDLRHASPPLTLLLDSPPAGLLAAHPAPSPSDPTLHAEALAALDQAAQERLKGAIRAAQLIATAEGAPR